MKSIKRLPFLLILLLSAPASAEEPSALLEALDQKQKRLDAQAAELEQERRDLEAAKKEISKKLESLEALVKEQLKLKKKLEEMRKKTCKPPKATPKQDAQKQTEADKKAFEKLKEMRLARVQHLVTVTEKMPPEAAARYLADLQEPLAASILSQMKARKAANAMALMKPSKAATLSRLYMTSGTNDQNPSLSGP